MKGKIIQQKTESISDAAERKGTTISQEFRNAVKHSGFYKMPSFFSENSVFNRFRKWAKKTFRS